MTFSDSKFVLELIVKICTVSLLVKTTEWLHLRAYFKKGHIFGSKYFWDRQWLSKRGLLPNLFRQFFGHWVSVILLSSRYLAGAIVLLYPIDTWQVSISVLWLFLTMLWLKVRVRSVGTNASYDIQIIIMGAAALAGLQHDSELVRKAALGFIAIQSVLSYFNPGLLKARLSIWRSGMAIGAIMDKHYSVRPGFGRFWVENPKFTKVASYAVLGFELLFPLVLIGNPVLLYGLLGFAFLFHLILAWAIQLHHFLWSWLATYPAIIFISYEIRGIVQSWI